jgi:hypothetical protein
VAEYVNRDELFNAIDVTTWYHQNSNKDIVPGANSAEHQPWFKSQDIYDAIKSLHVIEVEPRANAEEMRNTIDTLSDLRDSLDELTSVFRSIVSDLDERIFSLEIEIKKLLDK